jgi:Mrp family chromosome partitioning ATPase
MVTLFDWIIIDAPPVLPVSDASILAGRCDGVIVVVRAGSTSYEAVGTALQELQGKRVLGVVLNRAEEEATYGAYSYYGGNGTDEK